jgi:hypothetical protein
MYPAHIDSQNAGVLELEVSSLADRTRVLLSEKHPTATHAELVGIVVVVVVVIILDVVEALVVTIVEVVVLVVLVVVILLD